MVYLGLGSNVGERAANLGEAARRLGELAASRVIRVSPVYETEPVGPVEQGWFLNAVVVLETALQPHVLLDAVKRIEVEMGRELTDRWGPRLIDVDLLLYDKVELQIADLVLPHPELWNRRFVLEPLRDVLPDGALRSSVEARLAEIGEAQRVRRVRDEEPSL